MDEVTRLQNRIKEIEVFHHNRNRKLYERIEELENMDCHFFATLLCDDGETAEIYFSTAPGEDIIEAAIQAGIEQAYKPCGVDSLFWDDES